MCSGRVLATMAVRLVAAALAVALCTGANVFVLPAERLMIRRSAALYSNRGQAPLQAASVSGPRPAEFRELVLLALEPEMGDCSHIQIIRPTCVRTIVSS